jgi:uncharacterized protein
MSQNMKLRCQVCKKLVKASPLEISEESSHFPFCSGRCKLIDLGGWLGDKYKIITPLQSQKTDDPVDTSADDQ